MRGTWTLLVLITAMAVSGLSCGLSGGYPPAESLAGEMTPEWREFAERVDRACATNFNAGQADIAAMQAREEDEGWSDSQGEAAYRYIQAAHQQETHDEIAALGTPPAEPEIFKRWLWNVGRRAELMRRAGRKWETKGGYGTHLTGLRITALKIDADWLGQRFGLRVCTSNGPTNNREDGDYLEEVDQVCAERYRKDYALWRHGRFSPNTAAGSSLTETLKMAAVAPPVEQYELRSQILAIKGRLDRYQVRSVRSPSINDPAARMRGNRILMRGRDEIAAFGLPSCAWPDSAGPPPETG